MNNIGYNCINDYTYFTPNTSSTSLNPSKSLNQDNDFLFFRDNKIVDINNCQNDDNMLYALKKKVEYPNYTHVVSASNCKQNHNHIHEGFVSGEPGLIDTIPIMKDKMSEANKNMNLLLLTDSSLKDYELMNKIEKKESEDKKYIEKQKSQDKKFEEINKKMAEVEASRIKAMNEFGKLRGIQSQISGKKLSVDNVDEFGAFQIKGNGKCLSYRDDGNYKFTNCYGPDQKQKFRMTPVQDPLIYYNITNDKNVNNNNVSYPFYVVQPIEDSKQCLHAGNGADSVNISIKPCEISDNQKWSKVQEHMNCNV